MKKTITLLLAAAGFAAAASTDSMDITWNDNKATLSESMDAISVVFTLDLEKVGTYRPLYETVITSLFEWNGEDEYGSTKGGVEHYFLDDPGYDYYNDLEGFHNNSGFGYKGIDGFTEAIVGYTYGLNQKAKFYLTLIDAQGKAVEYALAGEGGKQRTQLTINNLTKHSAVGEIEVYGSVLSAEDIASAMTNIAAAPAVPEPTTATLSLLALAGLAARRRR